MRKLKDIMKDYSPSEEGIFNSEEDNIRIIKDIIWHKLSEVDRRVLILYAELGSQRKLGKELGLSASTCNKLIKDIRRKIYEHLDKYTTYSVDFRFGDRR